MRKVNFDLAIETPTPGTQIDPVFNEDFVPKGWADQNYVQGGAGVADIAALKAVIPDNRKNNDIRYVKSVKALFAFDSSSSETANDVTVIQPNSGTGRWLLTTSAGSGGGLKNYVANPDFEQSLNDWSITGDGTITAETAAPLEGDQSLKITSTGTSSRFVVSGVVEPIDLAYAGVLLDGSAVIDVSGASISTGNYVVEVYNSTDSAIVGGTTKDLLEGRYHYEFSFVPVAGKTYTVRIRDVDGASGDVLLVDLVRIGPDPKLIVGTATADAPGLLSAYEEGTWTPAWEAASGGAFVYQIQTGNYVKIGKMVWVYGTIQGGRGTLSGEVYIVGLPFPVSKPGIISIQAERRWATNMTNLGGSIHTLNRVLFRTSATNASTGAALQHTDMVTTTGFQNTLEFSGVYITD